MASIEKKITKGKGNKRAELIKAYENIYNSDMSDEAKESYYKDLETAWGTDFKEAVTIARGKENARIDLNSNFRDSDNVYDINKTDDYTGIGGITNPKPIYTLGGKDKVIPKDSTGGTDKPVVDITSNIESPKEASGLGIVTPKSFGGFEMETPSVLGDAGMKKVADGVTVAEQANPSAPGVGGKGGLGVGNGIQLASLAAQGIGNYMERLEAEKSVEDWHNQGVADPVYDPNVRLDKNIDDSYEQATIKNETAKQVARGGKFRTSSNTAAADVGAIGTAGASASGKTRTQNFNKQNEILNTEIQLNSNIAKDNSAVKRDYLERKVQHEKDYIESKNAVAAKKYDNSKQLAQEIGKYGTEKEYLDLEKEIHSDTDVTVNTQGGYTTSAAALADAEKDNNPISKARKMWHYRKLKNKNL